LRSTQPKGLGGDERKDSDIQKVYHHPDCPGATRVLQQNRVRFTTEAEAQALGIGWQGIVFKSYAQKNCLAEGLLRLSTGLLETLGKRILIAEISM